MLNEGFGVNGNSDTTLSRVRSLVSIELKKAEVLISYIKLAIISLLGVLYLLAPRGYEEAMTINLTLVGILNYLIILLIQTYIARKGIMKNWITSIFTITDFVALGLLIFSFHIQYEQPPSFYLKAPTFIYFFLFIVIQALRHQTKFIILAGISAVSVWLILFGYALNAAAYSATHSFVEYIYSDAILVGAEFDKLLILTLFTAVLARGVQQSQKLRNQSIEYYVKTEEQLRRNNRQLKIENEKKLKEAQKIARLGNWELDLDNNTMLWSDEMYNILNIDPRLEASFEVLLEAIHPDGRDVFGPDYEAFVKNNMNCDRDIQLRLKDGTEKFLREICRTEYDNDGKPLSSIGIVQDVTELKKVEEELREAKITADSANRAKSAFLANMSHELRTPLNAIIGFSQILEMQMSESLSEKQLRHLNNIKDGGNHLLEIVNDILDLAKVEAGKTEVDLEVFDFGKMLERSPSIINSVAHEKGVQVEVNIQPGLGWLNGDETRLKQVIFNLFSNAMKFTESGKSIGIEAVAENENFVVTVWDEGIGIPEKDLDRIFDPFEQVKGSKPSAIKGTGLGLAISKSLIRLHQGTITATSELGVGSRFTIRLPGRLAGEDLTPEKNLIVEDDQAGNFTEGICILVAEDNEMNKELVTAALSSFQLDFANSGEEAVVMASAKKYDLILMDIQLPGMDGIEAMKQIRAVHKKTIPIIALTAFAMKGDEDKFLSEGFDNYISKPIDIHQMTRTIEKVIRQD